MNNTPIKLELYLSDVESIIHAFEIEENEIGKSEYVSKLIWVINMQLRKQGFEIKKNELGDRVIVRRKQHLF